MLELPEIKVQQPNLRNANLDDAVLAVGANANYQSPNTAFQFGVVWGWRLEERWVDAAEAVNAHHTSMPDAQDSRIGNWSELRQWAIVIPIFFFDS